MVYTLIITFCMALGNEPVCVSGPLVEQNPKLERAACERVAGEMTAILDLSKGDLWAAEVKCVLGV